LVILDTPWRVSRTPSVACLLVKNTNKGEGNWFGNRSEYPRCACPWFKLAFFNQLSVSSCVTSVMNSQNLICSWTQ
jgi:hypothetical protein